MGNWSIPSQSNSSSRLKSKKFMGILGALGAGQFLTTPVFEGSIWITSFETTCPRYTIWLGSSHFEDLSFRPCSCNLWRNGCSFSTCSSKDLKKIPMSSRYIQQSLGLMSPSTAERLQVHCITKWLCYWTHRSQVVLLGMQPLPCPPTSAPPASCHSLNQALENA